MPQPPRYVREKNFTLDLGNKTDHPALNAEFDSAANSINDIRANLAILQADDGKLRPSVVTPDSISDELRTDLINGATQGAADAATLASTKAAEAVSSAENASDSADAAAVSAVAAQAVQMAANSDAVPEGATNLYFTYARVRDTVLAGLSTATNAVIEVGDSILIAFGKLQAQVSSLLTALADGLAEKVSKTGDETIAGIKTFSSSPVVPTVASSDNSTKAASTAFVAAAVNAGFPSGFVAHFAMSSAPTGWLKANGATVSRTAYGALFTAIGTTFGAGDGSTTFNLPDLRAEFIRGLDDGRGVDAGRVIGTAQAGDTASHSHSQIWGQNGGAAGYAYGGSVSGFSNHMTLPQTTGATGGSETRPRNIALLACIKY